MKIGCMATGLQSMELTAVKVRALPDSQGRTFNDEDWEPTYEKIEDLGTLCYKDCRPWYARIGDLLRGRLSKNVGRITAT